MDKKTKELLKQIDILSNCIQGAETIQEKNAIAYIIHTLIEKGEVETCDYTKIANAKIISNKHLFVSVK